MISAINTQEQRVIANGTVALTSRQSTSCSLSLRDNEVCITFPGVYAIQWSVTGELGKTGKLEFAAYDQDTALSGSLAAQKVPVGIETTLTSAPVIVVVKSQNEPAKISVKNTGTVAVIRNAVLSVHKVY